MKIITILLFLTISLVSFSQYHDSPLWCRDYNSSASTPEQLADSLHLQWQIRYSPRIPVWEGLLNQDLMQYDRTFEPLVADNKIFIGFNEQDKVVALEINSGRELWHYYAEGPVRMPLATNNGKIYFISDDG